MPKTKPFESGTEFNKNAQLIKTPIKGDIYEVKKNTNQYTLFKVDKVANDSIYFLHARYESNLPSGLSQLKAKGDGVYAEETLAFGKNELNAMFQSGEILEIDRK